MFPIVSLWQLTTNAKHRPTRLCCPVVLELTSLNGSVRLVASGGSWRRISFPVKVQHPGSCAVLSSGRSLHPHSQRSRHCSPCPCCHMSSERPSPSCKDPCGSDEGPGESGVISCLRICSLMMSAGSLLPREVTGPRVPGIRTGTSVGVFTQPTTWTDSCHFIKCSGHRVFFLSCFPLVFLFVLFAYFPLLALNL